MAIHVDHFCISKLNLNYEKKMKPNSRPKSCNIVPRRSVQAVLSSSGKELVQSGTVRAIPSKDAIPAMKNDGFLLLDIRPVWEREKAHVPGSLHVPLFVHDTDNSPVTLLKKWVHFGYIGLWTGQKFTTINSEFLGQVKMLVPDKDAKILVACGEGLRSLMAVSRLHGEGYRELGWLVGGFNLTGDDDFPAVAGMSKLNGRKCSNKQLAAVKDVRWSHQGLSLISCGYDCSSRLIDIEKGVETQLFKENQVVGVIKFHPQSTNLFLSGGSKGFIRLWDIRVGKIAQEYVRGLGPILDIDFSIEARHFISSSDISRSNISENSIIVWDVSRQVPLSNQVNVEAYICPCIRYHPFDPFFVAQSNGNYIANFSASPPFRLDKYKRYDKHGVSGFPIKCSRSLDGEKLASGSSNGYTYIYNYRSSKLLRKIKAYEQACIDVAFHPTIPNVMASCS